MYHSRYHLTYGDQTGDASSRELRRAAARQNNFLWEDLFTRDINLLSTLFKWEGLPETVDTIFMEQCLIYDATACIVFDPEFNTYLSLPCIPNSQQNIYYQSGTYRAISLNYQKPFLALTKYNKNIIQSLNAGDDMEIPLMSGVVCKDNPTEYPIVNTIDYYAQRIGDDMMTIRTLENLAKFPAIIETTEDNKLAIQRVVQDINSNVLAVYASKDIAAKMRESKVLNTGFNPAALSELWNSINNLRSEKLTAYGINNLNTADKKERLITDEVNSNNESISMIMQSRLKMRERFAEDLKSVFGIDAKVTVDQSAVESIIKQSGGREDAKDTSGSTSNTRL